MKRMPIFLILLMFSISIVSSQEMNENTKNPLNPNGGRVLKIEEVFRITDESGEFHFKYPKNLKVSPDGTIFISNEYQLKRKELFINYKNEGYFKDITDLKLYKNFLFIVDFQSRQVLEFELGNDIDFIRFIGNKGQGPGELQRPFSASIDNDIISVVDQANVSFFDIEGNYINRFKKISKHIDSLFIDKLFFLLTTKPKTNYIIEVYTIEGKRIEVFGKKYLKLEYDIKKGLPTAIIENTIYDGKLLTDGNFIYYINNRFGILQKYSFSGNLIIQKDLISIFGKNEKRKVDKNKILFLKNEYILTKKNRSIKSYDIFIDAKILNNKIYFLLDQHNILNNTPIFSVEILSIDKDSLEIISKYKTSLPKGEWIWNFEVRMEGDIPIFLVNIDSKEKGTGIYEFKPTNKILNQ